MGISGNISSRVNQIMLFGFVELLFDLQENQDHARSKNGGDYAWLNYRESQTRCLHFDGLMKNGVSI